MKEVERLKSLARTCVKYAKGGCEEGLVPLEDSPMVAAALYEIAAQMAIDIALKNGLISRDEGAEALGIPVEEKPRDSGGRVMG